MGGGGGSGESNGNSVTHGGLGGGVIILRANTATGSGNVNASGSDALDGTATGSEDGAGGAGAGGSILMYFDTPPTLPGLTVNANGGQGGDGDPEHGGGGGGGGGFVTVKADVGAVITLGGAKGANEGVGGIASEPGGTSTSNTGVNAFITLNTDYGDAPNTYGTISGGLGAYHSFQDNNFDGVIGTSEQLLLGAIIDGEGGGNPSTAANSDDTSGENDEDGITNLTGIDPAATGYTIDSTNIFITNQIGVTATLHAWLDFDKNGTFDADEYTSIAVADGLTNQNPAAGLSWTSAPGLSSVTPGSTTYLRFRLTTDTGITDSVPTGAADNGEVEDYAITVIDVSPDVVDITRSNPVGALTNANELQFGVSFSESVQNVGTADFSVSGAGAAGASITAVTGSGSTYVVTVDVDDAGSGEVNLDIVSVTGIQDLTSNNLSSVTQTDEDQSYTLENSPPSVAIQNVPLVVNNTDSYSLTAQFSEFVSDFFAGDVSVTNAAISNFIAVDADTYTFDVTPDGSGDITIDIAANVALDDAANPNTAASQATTVFNNDGDGDGIDDATEGGGDTDGDGIPNYLDPDSDGDGIPDLDEGDVDSDTDGIPDYLDTDSDNDGIPDRVEGDSDSDGDGVPEYQDIDSDNDGIPDSLEQTAVLSGVDTDSDGIDDRYDVDQTGGTDNNNDGIDDAVLTDTDSDGIPNVYDVDSDNDGIPDRLESGFSGVDFDNDGIDDYLDIDLTGGVDADGDGIDDEKNTVDTDHDGLFDYLDIDSDNDGASDTSESQVTLTFDGVAYVIDDVDGDGIADAFDVDSTGSFDTNMDGIDDDVISRDWDSDGVSDYLDLDSDNDGLLDVTEVGLLDGNGDGIADTGQAILDDLPDLDNDGSPDLRDLDSNDDGIFDIDGSATGALDEDNDGTIDNMTDGDSDGIPDVVDSEPAQRGTARDGDADNVPSQTDRDDDDDGIADSVETDSDSDNDGTPNRLDRDSDGDGLPDRFEANRPNTLGIDSDFDGIDEAFDVDASGGIDADNDGIDDVHQETDIDNDGIPDYLDTDTDGDGIPDNIEQMLVSPSGNDSDFDGIDDAYDADATGGADLNNDGFDDAMIDLSDMDGDGLLNFRDADSDGDGYSDADEFGDFNDDGTSDNLQVDTGLRTSLDGNGGSINVISLFGLLALALIRLGSTRFGSGTKLSLMRCLGVVLSFVLVSVNTQAQDSVCQPDAVLNVAFDGCFYGGFGVGQGTLKPDSNNSGWEVVDDSDSGYKMTVGYRFLPQWYAELSYADLGGAGIENLNPAIVGAESISYKVPSLNLGYYFYAPEEQQWSLFVKGGVANIRNAASAARVRFEEVENTQLSFGLGAEYQLTSRFFIRAEIDSYDADARQFVLSFNSYFGAP